MSDFFLTLGASKPAIVDTLYAAGDPLDLTGATITAVITKYGKSFVAAGTVTTIAPATNGQVTYSPATTDLTETGLYEFKWKVVWPSSGGTQFIPSDRHKIIEVQA